MPKVETRAPGTVRHIIPVSGKDSLCTLIVQTTHRPDLPYEYLFCDVRAELPETYAWLASVEKKLNIKINRVGKSLEDIIAGHGFLPSFTRRYCTKESKIHPMQDWVKGGRAIQYIGFRADEKNRIPPKGFDRDNVKEVYPLIELGITLPMVYKILTDRQIMPPSFFWPRLYDAVYEMCSDAGKRFMEGAAPWVRDYLFSWRGRSNCSFCFYQRLYEWVGLLEFHPDLFDHAEEMERVYGSASSEFKMERNEGSRDGYNDFNWNREYPLPVVRELAEEIFRKRVKAVYDTVIDTRHKPVEEMDMLARTSCGAYCGK